MLREQAKGNAFALSELVGLVCLGDEVDDLGLQNAATKPIRGWPSSNRATTSSPLNVTSDLVTAGAA